MICQDDHTVAWSILMYELQDAHEHLDSLIKQMSREGAIEEDDFAVQLGHVFAHLNRSWHGRSDEALDTISQSDHQKRSQFPNDLFPVG